MGTGRKRRVCHLVPERQHREGVTDQCEGSGQPSKLQHWPRNPGGLGGGSPEGMGGWGLHGGRAPGLVQWVWGHLKRVSAWYPEGNQHVAEGRVFRTPGAPGGPGLPGCPPGRAWEPGEARVRAGEWAAAAVMSPAL